MTLTALKKDLKKFLYNPNDYVLIKKIGQGGFGEVLLCRQKSTGLQVAIKKSLEELTESSQKYYCREVRILAAMENPFLINLIGFSPESPYTIITKFIPNGALYDYLKKGARTRLNGTQKTIIAMGIAHGMARFHEYGLMHRDLKSMNILLDENMYPVICDFGIARDKETETGVAKTGQIGTMFWMAPEMLADAEYNALVDVYSYAMILYELAAEKIPFEGLNVQQLVYAIANSYRPKLPEDTPKSLRALIELCWDDDPSQRPNFSRIYALFEAKITYFKDTDMDQVDAFIDYINRKTAKAPEKKPRAGETPRGRIDEETPREETDVTFEDIINPVKPVSPQTLAEYIGRMNFDQCNILVEKFYNFLKENTVQDSVKFSIYNAVVLIIQRGGDYIKILASSSFPSILTFDGEYSCTHAFTIIQAFVSETPELCPTYILDNLIDKQLNGPSGHLVMCILADYFKYVASDEHIHDSQNIIKFFTGILGKVQSFIDAGEIPEFLRIISYIWLKANNIAFQTFGNIQDALDVIFKADLTKERTHDINVNAIYYAYKFVIKHSCFVANNADEHAKDAQLRPFVISNIVSRCIEDNVEPQIPIKLSRLVGLCADYTDARLLVLIYANTEKGSRELSDSNDIWTYKEKIPPEWYIRMFLILTTNPLYTEKILAKDGVYTLFAKLSELHIPEVTKVICTIFRKLPNKIMNEKRIKFLDEKKFWGHAIRCLMESDSVDDQKECLSVLAFHAPTYVTEQMARVYSYLGEAISDSSPICLHALCVMQPFMVVPPIKKKFEDKGYIDKIRQLHPTPTSRPYIQNILSYYS